MKKRQKFNWITFLKRAIHREPTAQTCQRVMGKAGGWITCACGHYCKKLPRNSDGEPHDRLLSDMGMAFWCSINQRNWPRALQILLKIEARSTSLLEKQKP